MKIDKALLFKVARAREDIYKRAFSLGAAKAVGRAGLWGARKWLGGIVKPVLKPITGWGWSSAKAVVSPKSTIGGRIWGGLGALAAGGALKELAPPLVTAPAWVPYNILKAKYGRMPIPTVRAF